MKKLIIPLDALMREVAKLPKIIPISDKVNADKIMLLIRREELILAQLRLECDSALRPHLEAMHEITARYAQKEAPLLQSINRFVDSLQKFGESERGKKRSLSFPSGSRLEWRLATETTLDDVNKTIEYIQEHGLNQFLSRPSLSKTALKKYRKKASQIPGVHFVRKETCVARPVRLRFPKGRIPEELKRTRLLPEGK